MTENPNRKIAFVLAASDHGTMIVNRFDYHMVDDNRGFGVGFDILNSSSFDRPGVDFALGLLQLRRQYFGDGVRAIDCGANIGVFTVEWAHAIAPKANILLVEANSAYDSDLLAAVDTARNWSGVVAVSMSWGGSEFSGESSYDFHFTTPAGLACVSDKMGVMRVPILDYSRPASFGSVEIKKREHPEFVGQKIDYSDQSTAEIPCLTLDSLNLQRVDLIKVDVEGMELEVLAGATDLVRHKRPVVLVEFIKSDKDKLREWFTALEYSVFEFGINWIAIHKSDKTLANIRVDR